MFVSRDATYGFHECIPGLALLSEHTSSFSRNPVESPASFLGLLDPGTPDPSALLKTVKQWIEGIDVELELAAGTRVDEFAQLIAVPWPRIEQRKNEQLGGSPLQLAIK